MLERQGLSSADAAARLQQDGPNTLPTKKPPSVWWQLGSEMIHYFAIMLWVAGGLAIVAGMSQLGIAIFAVILLNGLFAFFQEYRAERASEKLRDLLPRRTNVVRDGTRIQLDAAGLVKGDLVVLSAGDRISADLELVEAQSLSIDSSTLTGESTPNTPKIGEAVCGGTFVVQGEGLGVVTATGSHTRLAAISVLTQAGKRPQSPLAKELNRVVRIIALIAFTLGAVFLIIAWMVGISLSSAFLFAIGVTVALVPEGLLPTVTLSLAMGAQRMAARNALVRRLESVETLGSTTFICTDKTGTLTLNEMSVVDVWTLATGDPSSAKDLAMVAGRCSTGDGPLDKAFHSFAQKQGVDLAAEEKAAPITESIPFAAQRRRASVVAGGRLLVKGASEAVFPLCKQLGEAEKKMAAMAERGLRVIAIAARPAAASGTKDSGMKEEDLDLLGLAGIEDPPRPEAKAALAACRQAGIRVAMLTGDHPVTARAIAREIGLLDQGELVVNGADLPKDDAVLGALLDREGVVISRVTPEDKLRITHALQLRGHVVAMTGDGVNDGPALQKADIGIAMGRSGTDVAREAADLVLLDDNFATIVAAIEQGRTTFANTRRFLTYHLTANIAELAPFVVWALSGGRFPLALGVLQVLALDIGTDILPALALGAEPSSARALGRRVEGCHLVDRALLFRALALLGPVEALMSMAAFVTVFFWVGWRPGAAFPTGAHLASASGAAFCAVVIGQMANVFACRSTSVWPGALAWKSNPYLLQAVAAQLVLLLAFIGVGPIARLLGHAPPGGPGLAVALMAFPAVLAVDFIQKRWSAKSPSS